MAMIPLKEYAERLGKNPVVAAQKAGRGTFQTARKIGCQWFVEETEPWPDLRVTSGKYRNWSRYRHPERRPEAEEKPPEE